MKILNDNILWIEFDDFVDSGISRNTLTSNNQRQGKNWIVVYNEEDKRMPLVRYDKLTNFYKEKLQATFGNPYDYVAKEPIKKLVEKDLKAEVFYLEYRYEKGGLPTALPAEAVEKYTTAASWLNMLIKTTADKKFIKKTLNLRLDSFWMHVIDLIKLNNIDLPASYQRLMTDVDKYKEQSYTYLIHSNYGNITAAKIVNKDCEDALLKILEHPNQYDDVLAAYIYNQWAEKNNYKAITSGAVTVWRKKKLPEIYMQRYGSAAFNERFITQVKGLAPTRVAMLWESDDYNLNFYYKGEDDSDDLYNRYVSYIVSDAKTKLILGKCIRLAKSPVVEMVKLAWIDAMYYVRSLTGSWHLPFEIKTDHWQEKALFPFFEKIGKFIPPAHANKHRGYLEQTFGGIHLKSAEKLAAHHELNYNGNNITAKNRGVNIEALNTNAKYRPNVGTAAETQIEKFFHYMREMPEIKRENMQGDSRKQQWLDNWNTLTDEQKRPITDEQFLLLFGFKHIPKNGSRNSITNRGVEPQINGVQYSYDVPQHIDSLYAIGKKVDVYYDPYDMSRVLVTDNEGLRFVATSATLQPRALEDTYTNSRTMLNMVLDKKKQQVNDMATKAAERMINIDAEAAVLGGFMLKEMKNTAEIQAEKALLTYDEEPPEFDINETIFNR